MSPAQETGPQVLFFFLLALVGLFRLAAVEPTHGVAPATQP